MPWLRRALTRLPSLHRRALDVQPLSQALLAQTNSLASSSKTTPLRWHILPLILPSNTEDIHTITNAHYRRSIPVPRPPCDDFAAVLLFSARTILTKVIHQPSTITENITGAPSGQ
jgi:hypothetical protein